MELRLIKLYYVQRDLPKDKKLIFDCNYKNDVTNVQKLIQVRDVTLSLLEQNIVRLCFGKNSGNGL